MNQYVIVCDESTKHGNFYSYFYGGAIINEKKYQTISEKLELFKSHIGLTHELKRINIDLTNCNRYIEMLDFFFTFVKSGDIRIRIMFSPNNNLETIPSTLDETFTKFYYLFIRHAFALPYAKEDIDLRLIFDALPEKPERREKFKSYLVNNLTHIPNDDVKNDVIITRQRIEEVDSKKHIILQCVDVIVGLIDFCLNNQKVDKGKSKRWFAKNKVLTVLLSYIEEMHPNFVLYKTTRPIRGINAWLDKYKHFVYEKTKKIKAPASPT